MRTTDKTAGSMFFLDLFLIRKINLYLLFIAFTILSTQLISQTAPSNEDDKAFGKSANALTIGYCYPGMTSFFIKADVGYDAVEFYDQYPFLKNMIRTEKVSLTGPLLLKFDRGLTKNISLGPVLGFYKAKYESVNTYQEAGTSYRDVISDEITNFSLGLRFNYHFATGKKIDPYFGVAGGYSYVKNNAAYSTNNPYFQNITPRISYDPLSVYFGVTVGFKYYFSKHIGTYFEIGLDKLSVLQGGIAFSF